MADNKEHWLATTFDNPYDPCDEYEQWVAFDENEGYYTNACIARLMLMFEDAFDDVDEATQIDYAVERLIRLNPEGMYKRVQVH